MCWPSPHPLKLRSYENENTGPEVQNSSKLVLRPLTIAGPSLQTIIFELEVKAFQSSSHSKNICMTELCCRSSVRYDLDAIDGADALDMLAKLQAAAFVDRPIYNQAVLDGSY